MSKIDGGSSLQDFRVTQYPSAERHGMKIRRGDSWRT